MVSGLLDDGDVTYHGGPEVVGKVAGSKNPKARVDASETESIALLDGMAARIIAMWDFRWIRSCSQLKART